MAEICPLGAKVTLSIQRDRNLMAKPYSKK